ncbi:MAG: cytochrome ubiquinol oxidase subunit I [Gemmatimonadota bacterium]
MDALLLARWQFTVTCVYHFFFVPLTLGLSIFVAVLETAYVRTGDEAYKAMTKFWGKLFLLNFAMGVVTGIVMEFQFGMNWAEYARFVGDIFGAPLAIEALLAFFLESTFLGIWIFGWDRLSKGLHAATIWVVALGSNLSALWILVANSFMQEPVGYAIRNGRAEMTDFFALLLNPHVWVQWPHVFFGGVCTAAFFVLGVSAYHLRRGGDGGKVFEKSFRLGAAYGIVGVVLVMLVGHTQGRHMVAAQPMKIAAAEALWQTEDPAAMSLFTWGDESERRDVFAIRVPSLLSILAHNSPSGEVKGIRNLQAEYEARYGPGDYVPPVAITYWAFRIMVGAGMAMLLLAGGSLYLVVRERLPGPPAFLGLLVWAIGLPYVANSAGWMMTEVGRMPWVVFGVMRVEEAVSKAVSAWELAISLLLFTVLYGALMAIDFYLLRRYATAGIAPEPDPTAA